MTLLDEPSEAVGIRSWTKPVIAELPLERNTYVLVYTDGLAHAGSRSGQKLEPIGLFRELISEVASRDLACTSAQALADNILRRAIDAGRLDPVALTEAMLRGYRAGVVQPQAPRIYQQPGRITAVPAAGAVIAADQRDLGAGQLARMMAQAGKIPYHVANEEMSRPILLAEDTGGGFGMTVEQRVSVVRAYSPELASLNAGSLNFALHPVLERIHTTAIFHQNPGAACSRTQSDRLHIESSPTRRDVSSIA